MLLPFLTSGSPLVRLAANGFKSRRVATLI
jgi:hypothetical protein